MGQVIKREALKGNGFTGNEKKSIEVRLWELERKMKELSDFITAILEVAPQREQIAETFARKDMDAYVNVERLEQLRQDLAVKCKVPECKRCDLAQQIACLLQFKEEKSAEASKA